MTIKKRKKGGITEHHILIIYLFGDLGGGPLEMLPCLEMEPPPLLLLIRLLMIDSLKPVSYTHLDVYKRQGWYSLTRRHYSHVPGSITVSSYAPHIDHIHVAYIMPSYRYIPGGRRKE